MTDKLAGPDIAGQTSNLARPVYYAIYSNKQATQTLFTGKHINSFGNVPSVNHQHNRIQM